MKDIRHSQDYIAIFWVVINFLEGMVLITYTYLISVNNIKQMVKFELFSFVLIWFIYPNVLRSSDFIFNASDTDSHWTSYVSTVFLYICLVINGYLPVIISYLDQTSTSYHFNPRLASNLYLFLSDELCYSSFYDYMQKSARDNFFIRLYVQLMKFKYKYTLEPDYYRVLEEANDIYISYFSGSGCKSKEYLDMEVINKIKNTCQILAKDEFLYEMFDDALVPCFEYLDERFEEYKKSDEYQILVDNLNLHSYVQCKMSNTGLINKY